jgi:hypothetical protein
VGLRGLHSNRALAARLRLQRRGWQRPVELVSSSGALTSTARSRRFRERRQAGKAVLSVVVDEVTLLGVLAAANLLDPQRDHSRADISRAVEQLLELLANDSL